MATIYFAAPLFSDADKEYNIKVVAKLEEHVSVFLPQRDGGLASEMISSGYSRKKAFGIVAKRDLAAIDSCAGLVVILNGLNVDDGVAFELGYAYSKGKYCIALQTDARLNVLGCFNPMIERGLATVVTNQAALLKAVRKFAQNSLV